MKVLLIIFAILVSGAAIYYYNLLTGRISDADSMPDATEDKVAEIKEVKVIKKATKKTAVKAKKVVSEVAKPKPKRGRPAGSKNKSKK